ncbi:MAG: hypothetical protein Q9160_008399 [Pyrenula sp. 1 TL-2023]
MVAAAGGAGQGALNGLFLALSLLPLASDLIPAKSDAADTIRVGAGMSNTDDGKSSPGGPEPNIAMFNGNGDRLGFLSGVGSSTIGDGQYHDIKVSHIDSSNNQVAEYISVSASGTGALCIAYLGITLANGDTYAWYGDTGQQCGKPWYASNLLVQLPTDGSHTEYKPACTWIDLPDSGSSGFPAGFAFNLPDFKPSTARAYEYQGDPNTMCHSQPRLRFYDSLDELQCIPVFSPRLNYDDDTTDDVSDKTTLYVDGHVACAPGPGGKASLADKIHLQKWTSGGRAASKPTYGTPTERTLPRNEHTHQKKRGTSGFSDFCTDSRLVISDHSGHSARELCQSQTSVGPDFYHETERLYCDMCTKTLYGICGDKVEQGCWDQETQKIRPKKGVRARGEEVGVEKMYRATLDWRSGK